jgi:PAS domain S-box-containing protein
MTHASASPSLRESAGTTDQMINLESRQELAALLSGADAGLALFDDQFNLIVCNAQYRKLFGYLPDEASAGVNMGSLIELSMRRSNASRETVATAVEAALDRRVIPSGMVVETVREVVDVPASEGANTQFVQIADAARSLMVHSLDVMADGFALYDKQDRLVVYNRRFVECKPSVADLIMPGVSFENLVREEARRGGVMLRGRSIESYIESRLTQHRNPLEPGEMNLTDGRWIQINEKMTDDGCIVSLLSDITHMKEREFDLLRISKQLHARNAHFDVALNNMIQGLCLFDKDQRLLVTNRRYLEMYGFSADVVKPGIKLEDIMRYSARIGNYTEEEAERAIQERRDRSRLTTRVTIKQRLRDGRVIAVMSEPMQDGGTVATYNDITEGERNEERLREHALKLERSNRDLEEFAYVASHDLQEPLRKIEAFGDRLAKRYGATLPEDGQMFVERMQHAAGRMRRLISDLLSYSRVMTKANPTRDVDLNTVLADVLGDLQIRIDEAHADVKAGPLPTLKADPAQMGQLLQNLLSNALKFVRPGVPPLITITASVEEGVTDFGEPTRKHMIRLADNGIGFDNKYKEQIFKIFQRLHGRLEYEGTGVGLATVRKIVERHHGSIDCDGRPGEGATFIIHLPIDDAPTP